MTRDNLVFLACCIGIASLVCYWAGLEEGLRTARQEHTQYLADCTPQSFHSYLTGETVVALVCPLKKGT